MNANDAFENDDIVDIDAETISVISNIQIVNTDNDIHNTDITDVSLTKPRRVSEIIETDTPIIPIPPDLMLDTIYTSRFEPRCVLCRSPFRERAEHWYLENGRKPNAVVNFFKKYFNAVISWECVDTHMNHHCQLEALGKNGLVDLEKQESDMARWRYRELDLAITGTLAEINDIRGVNCKAKPDLMLRKAATLDKLYSRLVDYKRLREDASANLKVDTFAILMEVYQKLPDEASKKVLLQTVQQLREQYT